MRMFGKKDLNGCPNTTNSAFHRRKRSKDPHRSKLVSGLVRVILAIACVHSTSIWESFSKPESVSWCQSIHYISRRLASFAYG